METHPPLLFWDVDTQVDFMEKGGKLYVPGAEALVPRLAKLTEAARRHGVPVVASADDHLSDDPELSENPDFRSTYPPHCLHGTRGQEKIGATRLPGTLEIGGEPLTDGDLQEYLADPATRELLLLKSSVDVFTNPNSDKVLAALRPEHVVLYGVALDVCVERAVEGLWQRGYRSLSVVTDAVESIDPQKGEGLLAEWRRRGIEMTTTDELLGRLEGVGELGEAEPSLVSRS